MSSANEFKSRYRKPTPIIVTVPGDDLTVECCRPALMYQVMSGLVPWPALQRVREIEREMAPPVEGEVIDNRPLPTLVDRTNAVGTMLDEWVCLAAVVPRVVLSEYDVTDDSVWVGDLPLELRQAIFNATFRVTPTAGADFRLPTPPAPPAPGQSGEAVRTEALVAVGDDGSDGGTGS